MVPTRPDPAVREDITPEIEAAAIAICKHRCRPGEDWRMFWCKGDLRHGMLEDARAVLEHLK